MKTRKITKQSSNVLVNTLRPRLSKIIKSRARTKAYNFLTRPQCYFIFWYRDQGTQPSNGQGTQPSNGQENSKNSDNHQSTSSGIQGEHDILPDHVFVCPNITPHLLEGLVPKHTFRDQEKEKFMAFALKRKYSYSIGYAFAWALLFEGLFSLLYHLCPSRYTFQFVTVNAPNLKRMSDAIHANLSQCTNEKY